MNPTASQTGASPGFTFASGYNRLREGLRERRRRRNARRWDGEDQARLDFYTQFISPGDLVFDIGANRGNRTKIFLRLGARVVAVEPQDECAGFLRSVFGRSPGLVIEQTALGDTPGEASMLLSSESTMATLSQDWVDSLSSSGRFERDLWRGTATVPVTTFDALIAKHGAPVFAKIDVEGFEAEVLSGLSQPVGALSLEYVPERIDKTIECLESLDRVGEWEHQLSLGESMEFTLPAWSDRATLIDRLRQVPTEQFGDVYARSVKG